MEIKKNNPASSKGHLTTHVLDTARGCPAPGVQIDLFRVEVSTYLFLASNTTNSDGRLTRPILEGKEFVEGVYELIFHAGDYIQTNFGYDRNLLFLDKIPIRFNINDKEVHYHIPLLLSPFGYSSYRGS